MEKNIHHDPMDDYVKKSFAAYEEDPSGNMWDRIEADLPPVSTAPAWRIWRAYRWQIAAASVIVILCSRLICVQFYYEEKLRAIQQEQENSVLQTPVSASESHSAISQSAVTKNNQADAKVAAEKRTDNAANNSSQFVPASITPKTGSTANNSKPEKNSQSVPSGINKNQLVEDKILNQESVNKPLAQGQADSNPLIPGQEVPKPAGSTDSATPTTVQPIKPETAVALLGQKQPELSFSRNIADPQTVNGVIRRFHGGSGWYVGIFTHPHLVTEQAEKRPERPGPQNPRHLFGSEQERPQVANDLYVRVGKRLNPVFALETGAGYQQLTRTATHRPWFQYRDGHPQPGPGNEPRSFEYDLNTYGGSATVSLRTEVNGNSTPMSNERVGAMITSEEQLQILRIPLLAVARLGHSRLQAVFKAGVLGSYLLNSRFEIEAYTLDNNKLRFHDDDSFEVKYDRPKRLIMGYELWAGAEFRVTRNLSLSLSPVFSADFPRNDSERGKLPNHTSYGLNAGASWWF